MRVVLWVLLVLSSALAGKDGDRVAANAGDIPALATLLEKTGWEVTPELTGGIHAGDIFRVTEQGHVLEGSGCFDATVRESTYTQVELVSELQAGVRVRFLGLGRAAAEGELVKKLKFGAPIHRAIAGFELSLSAGCRDAILRMPFEQQEQLYVVREVLLAEIAEQTCGRIDAEGRFTGLGSADVELQMACQQIAMGPVAVGFRTQGVRPLLSGSAPVAEAPAQRAPVRHVSGFDAPISHMGRGEFRDGTGELRSMSDLRPLLEDAGSAWRIEKHDRAKRRRFTASVATVAGAAGWFGGAGLMSDGCLDDNNGTCAAGVTMAAVGGVALTSGAIWWVIDGIRVTSLRRDIADDATRELVR